MPKLTLTAQILRRYRCRVCGAVPGRPCRTTTADRQASREHRDRAWQAQVDWTLPVGAP